MKIQQKIKKPTLFTRSIMAILTIKGCNSAIVGPIWPIFELVRDLRHVIVICKFYEDPTKTEEATLFTIIFL